MIALLSALLVAPASAFDLEGGNAYEGHRIGQATHLTGIGLYNRFVVGPDGGTNSIVLVSRYGQEDFSFAIGLPVAAHRTPMGRAIDMGNLELSGFYHLGEIGPLFHSVGLEAHVNVGDRAYTWVNDPEELWPGGGANVVYQGQMDLDSMVLLFRGTIGGSAAADFAPYPSAFMRVSGAAAIDYAVMNWVGVIGEMHVSYWDTSPWELSGMVRLDAVEGVRARAGIVLPIGVWAGLAPTSRPAGVRETTLMLDVSLAF